MADPRSSEGYAESAFEGDPPSGRTRVYHGNRESVSRDDSSRIALLESQVSDLLARLDQLDRRIEDLEAVSVDDDEDL
jgi:hypothetical protein